MESVITHVGPQAAAESSMLDLLVVDQLSAPASLQTSEDPAQGPRLSVSTATWRWTVLREARSRSRSRRRRSLLGLVRSVTTSVRRMEDVRSFTQVHRTIVYLHFISYSKVEKYFFFLL